MHTWPVDVIPETSASWRRPPTDKAPALDLTGKVTKLDNHYSKAGGFSDVYKGRCASSTSRLGDKEVAVKVFRFHFTVAEQDGRVNKHVKMVRRELGIWSRLSHPNIVPFLGVVYDFERRGTTSLVSEWMPYGTIEGFIAQYDDHLMLAHRMKFLLDIANGLTYLHSFPMVHGDLTCTNVLVNENFDACLTDFGLTSVIGDIPDALCYLQMTTLRPGALRWAAPEYFLENTNGAGQRTTKSDIYSFGNLALLILSGKHPWSEVTQDIAVVLRLHRGDKPSRPMFRRIEDKHWKLIERCWLPADERPLAGDIASTLGTFLGSCPPALSLQYFIRSPLDTSIKHVDPLPSPNIVPETLQVVYGDDTTRPDSERERWPFGGDISVTWNPVLPGPPRSPGSSFGFHIHRLLSGEAPPNDFYFNLSSPFFSPLRTLTPGRFVGLSSGELREPATYPPVTRARITHDAIPQWPIELNTLSVAITLDDVLFRIYESLHTQITHGEWGQLSVSEETTVATAYTRRWKKLEMSAQEAEASQGVRRVDYLLDKYVFKGLLRTHDMDGVCHLRLVTG